MNFLLLSSLCILLINTCQGLPAADPKCENVPGFTQELRQQIRSKRADVDKIIDLVLEGEEKHQTYNELAFVCDTYGPRLSGSMALDLAISHMLRSMRRSNLTTSSEPAMIPKWTIGDQWAEISLPRKHRMTILALGTSVGTPAPVEGEVVIIHTFDELDEVGKTGFLQDKIVVYNYNWTSYSHDVKYRVEGARRAAKYGAVAALVRSITPYSIYSPHAGMGSKTIPTAAIATEDADLMQRWHDKHKRIKMQVYIDAQNYDDVESKNVIGDITGSERPEEVVLVSGHIDSWYNTEGAMDDGGGMMIAYKALDVLSKLKLKAKRTIRAVLWTCEEFGLIGAKQYFKDHKHELDNFKVVIESDLGTFKPLGLSWINFGPVGQCVLSEIAQLTKRIDTNRLNTNYEGSDIELFTDKGVPGLSLYNDNGQYFNYHHTSGDSMSIEDPDSLDRATILWAVTTYILADLDGVDFKK